MQILLSEPSIVRIVYFDSNAFLNLIISDIYLLFFALLVILIAATMDPLHIFLNLIRPGNDATWKDPFFICMAIYNITVISQMLRHDHDRLLRGKITKLLDYTGSLIATKKITDTPVAVEASQNVDTSVTIAKSIYRTKGVPRRSRSI